MRNFRGMAVAVQDNNVEKQLDVLKMGANERRVNARTSDRKYYVKSSKKKRVAKKVLDKKSSKR